MSRPLSFEFPATMYFLIEGRPIAEYNILKWVTTNQEVEITYRYKRKIHVYNSAEGKTYCASCGKPA